MRRSSARIMAVCFGALHNFILVIWIYGDACARAVLVLIFLASLYGGTLLTLLLHPPEKRMLNTLAELVDALETHSLQLVHIDGSHSFFATMCEADVPLYRCYASAFVAN